MVIEFRQQAQLLGEESNVYSSSGGMSLLHGHVTLKSAYFVSFGRTTLIKFKLHLHQVRRSS